MRSVVVQAKQLHVVVVADNAECGCVKALVGGEWPSQAQAFLATAFGLTVFGVAGFLRRFFAFCHAVLIS